MDRRVIRWMATQWCNFSCSYCRQEHTRKQVYHGSPGHWADNRPVSEWISAFRAMRPTDFCITGGEFLLDRKNTVPLLEDLYTYANSVRVDSNLSWDPQSYRPNPKLELMCSFHPEHVTEEQFLEQVHRVCSYGFHIAMVTLVILPNRFSLLERMAKALPVPINANPLNCTLDGYTPDQVATLRQYIPEIDWPWRTGQYPTGIPCRYPGIAWEVDPDGTILDYCRNGIRVGSVFGDVPSRDGQSQPCPKDARCTCLDRYTYLEGMPENVSTPLREYSRRLPLRIV